MNEQQAQVRDRMLALAQHPDPYLFLNCVFDYLQAVPVDDQVRATAMRLAVQLQLFSVAEELARACPPTSPNYDQLQEVAAQFASRRSDLVEWASTDACFAANLKALGERGPEGLALACETEQASRNMPPSMTLRRAGDGNWLVQAARQNGSRTWLPAAQDFAGKTEAIGQDVSFRGDFVSPFLINGVGLGWLVPRLHAATDHTYLSYSPALYVVEPNVRALALVLRLHDWSSALADARVFLLAGASAWDEWVDLMLRHDELPEPRQVLSLTRWPGDRTYAPADYLQRIADQRKSTLEMRRQEVSAVYAGRDLAWWARRYEAADADDPLRVMCMTSRHTTFLQHSMRDLQAALERAGMRTELMIESSDHAAMSGLVTMRGFKRFQPDLIVVIDHHRYEMLDRLPAGVPLVCWIQDHMPRLFSSEAGRSLGPLDFTIGFGKELCVSRFEYPAERFMPCWLAVNPDKFADAAGSAEECDVPACDVVYIGHQAETPEALHSRIRGQLEPPVTHLVDAFFETMLPRMRDPQFNGAHDLEQMLREVQAHARIELTDEESRARMIGVYIRPLADRVLRHSTLEWVADWAEATGHTLHLYGRDWEKHPRFGKFARGEARHGAHLGRIVRRAAITLHCGINPSLHQRVLETSIAGGFLLIRHHPQDFYPPHLKEMAEHVAARGIRPPARIRYSELPPHLADAHRARLRSMGRTVDDFVDLPANFLEHGDAALDGDRRFRFAGELFGRLEEITFDSPESFARQANRYLTDASLRAEIAGQMQATVRGEFTYDALVGKLIGFVRGSLARQAT